jgi:predicted transcriptional regulator
MSNFAMSVELYMSSPVVAARPGDTLRHIQEKLQERRISSLPVVDADGMPIGVVSRTDLIRIGRMEAGRRPKSALLTLPDKKVEEVMSRNVGTVPAGSSVRDAAVQMVERRFHRVYVVDGKRLVGVFTTKDVMLAISGERLRRPINAWMSKPVFTIRPEEPIALATERLELARVSGIVVVESQWPVGVFTQVESLVAASFPRDTPVENVMSAAMLCLHAGTMVHRAAAQAAATTVRRVIVTEQQEMVGILTGLDFARAVM